MLATTCTLAPVLCLLLVLTSTVSATPNLGIQLDYDSTPPPLIISYSAAIEFHDTSIPGDKRQMSDAQFINLAKVAYDEMVNIWSHKQWPANLCPGAMMAMESEGRMYFASSVRSVGGVTVDIPDNPIHNSVDWFMEACLTNGRGARTHGGSCAEPNTLRMYQDMEETTHDNPPQSKVPLKTGISPRMAVWGRGKRDSPLTNPGTLFNPCVDTGSSWRCTGFVSYYGLKPVQRDNPDIGGQDNWNFFRMPNPRQVCASK